MLEISRHPIAVYPDETLRKLAESEGWRILDET
jgi:phosphoserine phosphatase